MRIRKMDDAYECQMFNSSACYIARAEKIGYTPQYCCMQANNDEGIICKVNNKGGSIGCKMELKYQRLLD